MKIIYKDDKTYELCNDIKKSSKRLGVEVSYKLFTLMQVLEISKNLYEIQLLPYYRLHKLKGDRKKQYSLTIHKGSKYRLIILPYDENDKMIEINDNEKQMLIKTVMIEILEVSEHYE